MSRWLKSAAQGSFYLILLGVVGCSTANDNKTNPVASKLPPQDSQSNSGAQKSPGQNLAGSQDKSSLDALQRGEVPKSSADSALKEVYFQFDSYDLSSDARATLKTTADWLKKNTAAHVDLEGHCDERGTNEYNLALGAKRAQAAKDYLMSLGIPAERLATTSFGEEIPVCQEHNEDCWAKNRRDRFVNVAGKPGV
jgi:peptidoglycan-associated lipoprotein